MTRQIAAPANEGMKVFFPSAAELCPACATAKGLPIMEATENIACTNERRLQTRPLHSDGIQTAPDHSSEGKASLEKIPFCEQSGLDPRHTHPIRYSLIKIDWSVVGTLTWKNPFRRLGSFDAEKCRQIDFKDLLKKTCSKAKVRLGDVRYYHATEYGRAGECHFHFLLQNTKAGKVPNSLLAETMQNLWCNDFTPFDSKQKSGGAGTAIISTYDVAQGNAAVDYCCKRELDETGRERERFEGLSDALLKLLSTHPTASLLKLRSANEKKHPKKGLKTKAKNDAVSEF